jgi:sulfate/thiosulfate transport system permease protein
MTAIARPRPRRSRRTLPGFGLALGFTMLYLSLIVLIPLAGVFSAPRRSGYEGVGR